MISLKLFDCVKTTYTVLYTIQSMFFERFNFMNPATLREKNTKANIYMYYIVLMQGLL